MEAKDYGTARVTPNGDGPHNGEPYTVTLHECPRSGCGYIYANEAAHLKDSLPHAEENA